MTKQDALETAHYWAGQGNEKMTAAWIKAAGRITDRERKQIANELAEGKRHLLCKERGEQWNCQR